jgi:hypothetical protein
MKGVTEMKTRLWMAGLVIPALVLSLAGAARADHMEFGGYLNGWSTQSHQFLLTGDHRYKIKLKVMDHDPDASFRLRLYKRNFGGAPMWILVKEKVVDGHGGEGENMGYTPPTGGLFQLRVTSLYDGETAYEVKIKQQD